MQNASRLEFVRRESGAEVARAMAFPQASAGVPSLRMAAARTRFERLLIFVLCTLWAIVVVMWSMVSLVGVGHGALPTGLALGSIAAPTSLPTLQSATVFAIRLVLGW